MTTYSLDQARVQVGKVSARYFRENAAQAGLDLQQILPEIITNADAAIAAGGRTFGQIRVSFGEADRDFVRSWKRETKRLRVPYAAPWQHEMRCVDNGIGVTTDVVEERLAELGATPDLRGQRGLFGRGLREVWLAQGGGRIIGIRAGRLVEAWFFLHELQAFAFQIVREEDASELDRSEYGIHEDGTCVIVPLEAGLPAPGRLRRLLADHVQLRPVLEDPNRDLWLQVEDEVERVSYQPPEPDPDRPVLFDGEIAVGGDATAQVVIRRSPTPFPSNVARGLRRGGLVIRSGRSAHEATLGRFDNRPGAQHLYGEVRFDAIDAVQRRDLDAMRPELIVRVDRSGLNEHHPLVSKLQRALDAILEPIVLDEERRAGASRLEVAQATKSRDLEGLRTLNRVLRQLFREDGTAPVGPGDSPSPSPPVESEQMTLEERAPQDRDPATHADDLTEAVLFFKRSPMRLHPSESRDVALVASGALIPLESDVELEVDGAVNARALQTRRSSKVNASGRWTIPIRVRARANAKPGSRPLVTARVGNIVAHLDVVIVSHRASGWVTEIVRRDETAPIEADFNAETGVVTVYEGRPEFRKLEAAARAHGYKKGRFSEFVPFRMLEVEAAANAVYHWAASELVRRRVSEEQPLAPDDHAQAVRHSAQELRRQSHAQLMQAFLPSEVFEPPERLRAL